MKVFGNTIWHLVAQADAMCKFVLLFLFCMSVICWTILLYKFFLLRIKKRQLKRALSEFRRIKNIDDLLTFSAQLYGTFPGYLISMALKTFKMLAKQSRESDVVTLGLRERDMLQQTVDQTVVDLVTKEESLMPFISASAAVAPLIGLFGTVWGLVDAFISIGQRQSADIATIAPGIAEALITTVAGLLVAIPALLMVYYLNSQIRFVETQLYALADRFIWFTHTLVLDHITEQKMSGSEVVTMGQTKGEQSWRE